MLLLGFLFLVFPFMNLIFGQIINLGMNEVEDCNDIKFLEDSPNGTLETLGYPNAYPAKRYCEVLLTGNMEHRVVLRFVEEFYLSHPYGPKHHKKHASCDGLDNLRIYDGLKNSSKILGEYCGVMKPLPLMSSGSNMTLVLTSYTPENEAIGYRANYAFVNNFGITSGKQIESGKCLFHYDSDIENEGIITSPNPGGLYPRNTNCSYIFEGTFLQRVFLKFHHFDLEGIEPCTAKSGSDFLEFSNMEHFDPCPARRCGRFAPQEILSDGPYFRITFRSNGQLSGIGFSASYQFLSDEELPDWASYLKGQAETLKFHQFSVVLCLIWISLLIVGEVT